MKVAIPVDSEQKTGGGFTFARNLAKGLQALHVEIVQDPLQADIALIPGATMITKETFQALREKPIKTIVRLDNVPRNSRNRGAGTTRLQSFAKWADEVVWQSQWAKFYLEDFIGRQGVLIHNGVDLDVFRPDGEILPIMQDGNKDNIYCYSRSSRDETKNWEEAWYEYQLIQRENKNAKLIIVGRFSPEIIEYNFDFFRDEQFEYLGVIEDQSRMAKLLRSCGWLLATYFNDAFSNTYLEALCSGTKLYQANLSGGTSEMIDLFDDKGRQYFSLERMATDYLKLFNEVLNR